MDSWKRRLLAPPRWFSLTLAVAGALAIGYATLLPAPEQADRVADLPVACIVCGDLGGTDVSLNLLLFAPFAAGLALMGVRTRRVLVVAALMSLTIETLQFAYLPGRDASLSDLLTNTTGATVVAWLVHRRALLLFPDRAQAMRLTTAALAAWIGLECIAGWSLAPSLPETVYWGQWAPDLGHLEQFKGTVLGAVVGGDSMPPHRLTETPRFRQRLLQDGGPVATRAVTGHPPASLAPIVSIFDGHSTEILLLGQQRDQVVFRMRTHVSDLRMRPPAVRIDHALPIVPGESLALEASYLRGQYRLLVTAGGRAIGDTVDASPNWAWSYFMPFENYSLGRNAPWLTMLWIGGLLLPIGYWEGRGLDRGLLLGVWALVGATLAVAPRVCGLPPVHLLEWVAAVVGLAAGHWLGERSERTSLARAGA